MRTPGLCKKIKEEERRSCSNFIYLFIYLFVVVVLFGWSFMPKFGGWSALDVVDFILFLCLACTIHWSFMSENKLGRRRSALDVLA